MVSIAALGDATTQLVHGLGPDDRARVQAALDFAADAYGERLASSGQSAFEFSLGAAVTLALLRSDAETRIAGLLFELCLVEPLIAEKLEERFGKEVADMVHGVHQLIRLRDLTAAQAPVGRGKNAAQQAMAQVETLRKMLLAMATDMRVVLVRLASCVTTLRYFAEHKRFDEMTHNYGREVLDLYAPLANRLGIFQLKWELEDLAFRMIEPETYKRIAKMLEEKRMLRESFVASSIERLEKELAAAGIKAEVSGRPKHIYSIWKKMRGKELDFSELYDVRAFRVIVPDVKTCYTVLGLVHNIWTPIPKEFDDYISRPKPNGYQSLHTVVTAEDGRPLEVQIRTQQMHNFAEYGVAAHWRYKEEGGSNFKSQQYDEKIAWLRQLLAWKSDVVADTVAGQEELQREWVEKLKSTTLDDRIFVLTPQARVLELPQGATPIDFAYHLHSEVGQRCRGAKIDGVMVPLNTPLKNGQTCEIITAKGAPGSAGPSRDWLSPGYTVSSRTRAKIRAWFHAQELAETLAHGRALLEKSLQREGKTAVNLEALAHKLGFAKVDDLFIAVGKEKFSLRHVEAALHDQGEAAPQQEDAAVVNKSRASSVEQGAKSGVLVVGTEGMLTMLAKCCKPAPPDPIVGFVTRGKGVSIHRASCKNFGEMASKAPERVIETEWGRADKDTVYPIDIFILAADRQGLLRDISEVLAREKINVIGVNTQTTRGLARMVFTAEIGATGQLQKALAAIGEVSGVQEARPTLQYVDMPISSLLYLKPRAWGARIGRYAASWWAMLHLGAVALVMAMSPSTWHRANRLATSTYIYASTWAVLPWFTLLTALISLVIIRIVLVTAQSYGLSGFALEMMVRVLVLELIPLSAAMFAALRAGMAFDANAMGLAASGVAPGDAADATLRRVRRDLVPQVIANAFSVLSLAMVSSVIVLVLAYLNVYGLSPWGLGDYTRTVGRVFNPVVTLGFVFKTVLFGLAVAVIPSAAILDMLRHRRRHRSNVQPGALRLLFVLLLIEASSLAVKYI